MLTETLADLVRKTEMTASNIASETELEMEKETTEESSPEETQETEVQVASETSDEIKLTKFASWFEVNKSTFQRVKRIKVELQGVDVSKTVLFSVIRKEDDERELHLVKNFDKLVVPNLPGEDLYIYSNGLEAIGKVNDDVFVKTYSFKLGLMSMFCIKVDDILIPYHCQKLKHKDEKFNVVLPNEEDILTKLGQTLDKEALMIMYKQSTKRVSNFQTNKDAIVWLIERQKTVGEINHLLQIDFAIIQLVGGVQPE